MLSLSQFAIAIAKVCGGESRGIMSAHSSTVRARVQGLSFYFGEKKVLDDVSFSVAANRVTALIGPSGCGKTTLLRCFNRMHDLTAGARYEGAITLQPEGADLLGPDVDPIEVRMRVGMVFQKPNPFPKSIFENVVYGLRIRGESDKTFLEDAASTALQNVGLWEEVKDRLYSHAMDLSGGQQQRLCIARALAVKPELLLFDEPTSALDPLATAKIEELLHELKERVTVLIVTHNMHQALRVSDNTAFMYLGKLVEFGPTKKVFGDPQHELTRNYVAGEFG